MTREQFNKIESKLIGHGDYSNRDRIILDAFRDPTVTELVNIEPTETGLFCRFTVRRNNGWMGSVSLRA